MKKYILLLLVLILASSLLFIGCSDDDDEDTVVSAAVAQGWILAEADLSPEIDFDADFMKITNNTGVTVDSVIAGDSLCDLDNDSYWYVYGDQNWSGCDYYNPDDSMRFSSGDTYAVSFYFSNGVATGSVKLLDRDDDEPTLILPIDDDTLSLGTTINVLWNSIPNADWYGLYIRYYKDSSGVYVNNDRRYIATTDTTLTLPASSNVYNGYYYIYVQSCTGPGPNDSPNITGAGWNGDLHSESSTFSVQVFLGNGDPTPVGDQDKDDIEDVESVSILRNIVDRKIHKPIQHQNQ